MERKRERERDPRNNIAAHFPTCISATDRPLLNTHSHGHTPTHVYTHLHTHTHTHVLINTHTHIHTDTHVPYSVCLTLSPSMPWVKDWWCRARGKIQLCSAHHLNTPPPPPPPPPPAPPAHQFYFPQTGSLLLNAIR